MGASSKGQAKGKGKENAKTTPREETASVAPQKANVHLEMHAHSSKTRTRKAKGRDDLVHLLRQVDRTEIRIADGNGSDDGSAKGTSKLTGKSPSGKANRLPCTNYKKESCQRGNSRNYWHVP